MSGRDCPRCIALGSISSSFFGEALLPLTHTRNHFTMLDLLLTDILVLKSFQFALLLTLSTSVAAALLRRRNLLSKYPLINGRRRWEFLDTNAKKRFAANAKDLIIEGFSKVSTVAAKACIGSLVRWPSPVKGSDFLPIVDGLSSYQQSMRMLSRTTKT